jgi:hypothetical protein
MKERTRIRNLKTKVIVRLYPMREDPGRLGVVTLPVRQAAVDTKGNRGTRTSQGKAAEEEEEGGCSGHGGRAR